MVSLVTTFLVLNNFHTLHPPAFFTISTLIFDDEDDKEDFGITISCK